MATTKKTSQKKTAKRHVTKKEYDSITDSYYRLKKKVYKLAENDNLYDGARSEMKSFVRALEKARSSVNWAKATNYTAG